MLYWLLGPDGLLGAGIGVLGSVTFRAAAAALSAFALCILFGPPVIAWLQRLKIGERTDKTDSVTLAELHKKKVGTPTMGGLLMCGAVLASFVLWSRITTNKYAMLGVAVIVAYGIVGFADDWIKLKDPGRKGLSARWKFWAMFAVGIAVGFALYGIAVREARPGLLRLHFPLWKEASLPLDFWLGLPFVVLTSLMLTGLGNAVNLTDGMDGLASGCTVLAGLAMAAVTYVAGHKGHAEFLQLVHVPGASEMSVLCAALVGGAMGFLWFNAAPALVFMGDVGSLPLGGVLGYAAMVARMEIVLLVVGAVFVAEALSVMLQVAWFKRTGRRVFRCAPLHHHFQFAQMPETRVVIRFWIVAALAALASLAVLRVG